MGLFAERKREPAGAGVGGVDASPPPLPKRGAISSAGRVGTKQSPPTRPRATLSKDGATWPGLVGPVTESKADHLRRHNGFHAKCPRCRFYKNGERWRVDYGTVEDPRFKAGSRGQVAVAEWLAVRPAHLGGHWALGCRICACAAECPRPETLVGARHKWARYEATPIKAVLHALREHSASVAHREAVKMHFLHAGPRILQRMPAEDSGFVTRGSAPTGTLAISVGIRSLSEDSVADGKARPHAAFYQQRVGQAC